jgi:glyoxylase-like metal-dependent hydrolase (beta-lactamase superfamily II)
MVGDYPRLCPFCKAARNKFLTSEECSAKFNVAGHSVGRNVTRLNSVPPLGLEHAAYRVETGDGAIWIDCPSSFDRALEPADTILFTHHHFLGASNQYRNCFDSKVWIHELDSAHNICRGFSFDMTFKENFSVAGIEAFHIGGHTPGFTFYVFDDVLFICDYVFLMGQDMKFNSYGPRKETREGGVKLHRLLQERRIGTVCGYNYVCDFISWMKKFEDLAV